MARRLNLSNDMIQAQLKTIFGKLGVHDRTHAVTVAVRRGYINPFSCNHSEPTIASRSRRSFFGSERTASRNSKFEA
ncbi:MAG: hypothetical protein COC10_05020 [Sphingobium sp.]|nr:MAG: hypothetical protein COC10_05020 [Sphingobium sp.]